MRKTKDSVRMNASPRALSRYARSSAVALGVALGIGLVMASGPARAGDDEEDDRSFEEKIIDGLMKGIGATNMENSGIDYRERSPLVVPPKLELPPPEVNKREASVPNWPKDPDEARQKAMVEKRKKEKKDTRDAGAKARDAQRPLSPSELDVVRAPPDGAGNRGSDSATPGAGGASPLSPSQLGFDGRFSNLFGGSKTEATQFKGEPTRDTLTQPPPGYQTPSPNFAYGTGKQIESNYTPYAAGGKNVDGK